MRYLGKITEDMSYAETRREVSKFATAEDFMYTAIREAARSSCQKSRRGAVIVNDKLSILGTDIIGKGHNKASDKRSCELCLKGKFKGPGKKVLCSATYAEQMAIDDIEDDQNLREGKTAKQKLKDSTMYCVEIDENNNPIPAVSPTCTLLSRLIYSSGIKEVVLSHEEGFAVYDIKEFHKMSYDHALRPYLKNNS